MRILLLLGALALPTPIAMAETLKADLNTSVIEWVGEKVAGKHTGTVKLKSGQVEFKEGKPVGGEFVIDMKTIKNLDLESAEWNAKLVNHLKSDDFFNVAKYPTAKFAITSIKPASGPDKFTIAGKLTVKNITKPLSFPATIKQAKSGAWTATADFKVDRLKWDIRYNSGKFFDPKQLGDKMISDDIKFTLKMATVKSKKKPS